MGDDRWVVNSETVFEFPDSELVKRMVKKGAGCVVNSETEFELSDNELVYSVDGWLVIKEMSDLLA